jgi:hypothetical protein
VEYDVALLALAAAVERELVEAAAATAAIARASSTATAITAPRLEINLPFI